MIARPTDDKDLLAGEYVIGLLDESEQARFERELDTDHELRSMVSRWRERLAPIDHSAARIVPSEAVWSRILKGLDAGARVSQAVPLRERLVRLWDSLAIWRGLAFASLVAMAISVATIMVLQERARVQPAMVAVLMTENNIAAAVVNTYADGRVELLPLQDVAVPEGRALEIWTLWDRSVGPRSVGLIRQARSTALRLDSLPLGRDQLFEITIEPATGSPTQRPTGPIVAKGLTAVRL